MKALRNCLFIFLLLSGNLFSSDRKVLLEMFTNAHCYSCVAAYEFFRQYNSTNSLSSKSTFIFYHIAQPGVEDSIYFQDKTDSDARNNFYGPFTIAPLLFRDGTFVGNNIQTWQQYIGAGFLSESPFEISVSGTLDRNNLSIETSVKQTGGVTENDLRINIVLTESVETYIGKNGVTPQVFAMRKLLTGPNGETFSSAPSETKKIFKTYFLKPDWITETMYVVVFIQSASKKTVYQSEMKSISLFSLTSAERTADIPRKFSLEQNYPDPFNPSTSIRFSLESDDVVSLRIYNLLGEEIATLVDERLSSGNHAVAFDAARLSSGMYFYRLQNGGNAITRKMRLIK